MTKNPYAGKYPFFKNKLDVDVTFAIGTTKKGIESLKEIIPRLKRRYPRLSDNHFLRELDYAYRVVEELDQEADMFLQDDEYYSPPKGQEYIKERDAYFKEKYGNA